MEDEWVIGIDEAGRGPVIGPLVVSALAVPIKDLPLLKEMGVKDSKELSAPQRLKIKSKIFGV